MTDFDSDFDPVSLASFSDQADEAAEDLTMKALRGRDLNTDLTVNLEWSWLAMEASCDGG